MVFIQKARGKEFCLNILNVTPSATQEHVRYPTTCTSTFLIFCCVFSGTTIKQRAKGLAKICLIYWGFISRLFSISFTGTWVKNIIILLYFKIYIRSVLLCSTSKINESPASSSLRTAGYLTVHLLGVLS